MNLAVLEEGQRGIYAANEIEKSENVVFVPYELMITLDLVLEDPVCKSLLKSGFLSEEN